MAMDTTTTTDKRETVSLIASDKVEGTPVYGADGKKIGKVERLMIDKITGKVAYAVITFGGFMGIGEDYYPIPWSMLKYDTQLEGYLVNLTADQLKSAPKYSKQQSWDWNNRQNDKLVYDYYGAAPFWY
jgi:sporulation protein YlmC with PRC-barrel domain